MSFAYLASPYSHPDREVVVERFALACEAAAKLMEKGEKIFSPIAHSHSVEWWGMRDKHDGDWWLKQDFAILKHASKMYVLTIDGWEDSYGVKKELAYCKRHKIPVEYVSP